ncbi:MAG: hypothetical protein FWC41_05180 [Firmicutes bacterium]|nr:hypothetical protein [Bacillota bacterium]
MFVKSYNKVIKLRLHNVPKEFIQKLRKYGYRNKKIFYATNEYRAYEGQNYYSIYKGLY